MDNVHFCEEASPSSGVPRDELTSYPYTARGSRVYACPEIISESADMVRISIISVVCWRKLGQIYWQIGTHRAAFVVTFSGNCYSGIVIL